MKRLTGLIVFLTIIKLLSGQGSLEYYLPEGVSYDPSVPTPGSFIGFEVGTWHVTHDKLYHYMKEIDRVSDRAVLVEYGRTYENRPLVHLIFTSPANHQVLEDLRLLHRSLSDPEVSARVELDSVPLVVKLGYSIHGNESSGANASLLTAYYLAAARGPAIDSMLASTIILVDPCMNPDGLTRHATWANMYQGNTLVADPANKVFHEDWPGSRTNHYWFDLNRDYLLLVHPESQDRVRAFHDWKPNVVTDHHEMGASTTFFFQPGIPTRNNPWTPEENLTLTEKIGRYHMKALDKMQVLYYSGEDFDDFYYGKGSSYPDVNGSIGILFEQAGFRAPLQETRNGIRTFAYGIRTQFRVSLSTLEAAVNLRDELLGMQREFYRTALTLADRDQQKAYVFGDPGDMAKTWHFIDILRQHQIRVYKLNQTITVDGQTFSPGSACIIPLRQPQYRLIKACFETVTRFVDSTFYDISTWTIPLTFNMPYAPVERVKDLSALTGREIVDAVKPAGEVVGGRSTYAYLFRWDEYYTPAALYRILDKGINAKVATREFSMTVEGKQERFSYGTILVPLDEQPMDDEGISRVMKDLSAEFGIRILAVNTGYTPQGMDLGSGNFIGLTKPKILMVIGEGTSSRSAGELWHLLDQRYRIPLTLIDNRNLGRINLYDYTTLILPGGNPDMAGGATTERLKSWLSDGGTLIACRESAQWLTINSFIDLKLKPAPAPDPGEITRYVDRDKFRALHEIPGAILNTTIDRTHPLCYGYHQNQLPVFKTGTIAAELPSGLPSCPVRYSAHPLMSGYVSEKNIANIKNTPFVITYPYGRGTVVLFIDHVNFRGIWFGTNKLFANAIFFSNISRSMH